MGILGVEGVFRRCCEVSLRLLRQNKGLLMTAMEVFLYDPLFKWLLSPIEAFQLQANMGEENPINRFGYKGLETQDRTDDILHLNSEAAKALLRINNKLQGYDGNEVTSVEGQVHTLITDASNPRLLSHMFDGWAPWV